MSRRKGRELALQILFQEDLTRSDPEEIQRLFWETQPAAGSARAFAEQLFQQAVDNEELIDGLIRRHARHWRLERMAAVDRNVLRMAIAEFLFMTTPKVVVIDEAVEIARKFGTEKSPEFVNGILDAVREELERSAV
jgi:N utilization substance protein B